MENVAAVVRIACVTLLLAVATARTAEACSCMASGPPCQNFFTVQAVFVGTVREITRTTDPQRPPSRQFRVEFEETNAFKGADPATQTVLTATDGAACGFPFKVGERYVVYASQSKPGAPLHVYVCSRTRHVSEAADDLVFFKSLSNTSGGPRVFGSITHREPGTIRRDGRDYGPVAGAQLTLRSDAANFQTQTDARGRYEFSGVQPGTYQLAIQAPPELAAYDTRQQIINLREGHSCAEQNFVVRFDGRVRGTVRSSTGAPAANVRVQLMPIEFVETTGLVETIDATTDAAGQFELGPVTPGRYVVGVDLFRMAEMEPDPAGVFPTTYHPGTQNGLRATIVELRGGELHALEPMTLPPPRHPYQLTGIVTLEDGTPAAGVSVSLLDANRKWLDVAPSVETDNAGAFSFLVHEGLSYIVSASYRGRDARGQRRIPVTMGPVAITKQPAPLTIVVPRP